MFFSPGSNALQKAGEAVEIREVRTHRDLKQFIRLPWRIYAGDVQWVPPLMFEVAEFLNRRKHPFYLHGDATTYLALRGGKPVGRILVSDDPHYNQQHGTNVGCFGLFECDDDRPAAAALIDAAGRWLRARGRSSVMGPIDYSANYPCGLLIEGFDTPPRIMMNHHRPYYGGLLESCGLGKIKDLYAWWFDDPYNMVDRWKERAKRIARRTGVVIRPFRPKDFLADVERCRQVYNSSQDHNWGFVRLSDAEFLYIARQIERMAVHDQVLLAEIDGRPVAFSITLPDFNEATGPLNGRLTTFGLPIGLMRLLYRKRRIGTARVLVLDILEGYRRRGIGELLILQTLDYGKRVLGYRTAELGWTLEDNHLINRMIEAVGGRRYKTYRIYEKQL